MTVAVAYKWAGDSQEAVVRADGSIDFGRAKAVVSDHDAVAITLGLGEYEESTVPLTQAEWEQARSL